MDCIAAFAVVLRAAREQRGLTQRELAMLARVHLTFVGRLERGEQAPTLPVVFALAVALDVEPHALVRDAWKLVNRDAPN
jgi:transcriptional regulator with XRE-family HTH domain